MKIGIICAMPIELDYLRHHLNCTPVVLKKQTFYLADSNFLNNFVPNKLPSITPIDVKP